MSYDKQLSWRPHSYHREIWKRADSSAFFHLQTNGTCHCTLGPSIGYGLACWKATHLSKKASFNWGNSQRSQLRIISCLCSWKLGNEYSMLRVGLGVMSQHLPQHPANDNHSVTIGKSSVLYVRFHYSKIFFSVPLCISYLSTEFFIIWNLF